MQDFIIEFINQSGYWGLGVLIVLENIILLIPSEVILLFGGFMTTYSSMNVWLVILSTTIGSVIGAMILYSAGRFITPEHLEKLISGSIGRVLHLQLDDIEKANSWFARKGYLVVFFCRFIPIIRCLISIPAGTAKMNLGAFLVLTALGTSVWNTVLVWLGVFAGKSWHISLHYMGTYSAIAMAVTGLIVFVVIRQNLKRKRVKDRSE
ncbi:MAG: DedA family protein [Desulfotomaculaceae bacterium]|nr:DedA family protein [Desulfotomaculaceae bacterium]